MIKRLIKAYRINKLAAEIDHMTGMRDAAEARRHELELALHRELANMPRKVLQSQKA